MCRSRAHNYSLSVETGIATLSYCSPVDGSGETFKLPVDVALQLFKRIRIEHQAAKCTKRDVEPLQQDDPDSLERQWLQMAGEAA